ncbi:hypothetical protein Btru_018685 [Bulinus truncatus]|nr:hypothetical protein Btru_018685 [Bulinus truncatus]
MPYLWQSAMSNMVIQRGLSRQVTLIQRESSRVQLEADVDAKAAQTSSATSCPTCCTASSTPGPSTLNCVHFDFGTFQGFLGEPGRRSPMKHFTTQGICGQYRSKSFNYRYNTILVPVGMILLRQGAGMGSTLTKQDHANRKLSGNAEEFPVLVVISSLTLTETAGTGLATTQLDHSTNTSFVMSVDSSGSGHTQHLELLFYKKWELKSNPKFFQHSSFLQTARRALGLFMHHDAITGTSSQISPVWNREEDAVVLDNVFELTFLVGIPPLSILRMCFMEKSPDCVFLHLHYHLVVNTPQLAVSGSSEL